MSLFKRGVDEVVDGLRKNAGKEQEYVTNVLKSIKQDLSSNDLEKKSSAVLKLCYLHIHGFDMRWAQFAVIEVMSHAKYTIRRPGFLACALTFDDNTEVALLATHIFQKSIVSPGLVDANMALNTLASMCIPIMTEELLPDLQTLLKSSRTTVRKKTIAAITKAITVHPPAVDSVADRLADRLADDDPAVQGAAVDSLLTLARKEPHKYIGLAPKLFEILKDQSSWNWAMIKSLKLVAVLAKAEPRVGKRFAPVVQELLTKTGSKAVELEVARLVLLNFSPEFPVFSDAMAKLKLLVESVDKNLKYVGLSVLSAACTGSDPERLEAIKREVPDLASKALACAGEKDPLVRKHALAILNAISAPETFPQIVNALLEKSDTSSASSGANKRANQMRQIFDDIACGVVERAGEGVFKILRDFDWWLRVLADLARRTSVTAAAPPTVGPNGSAAPPGVLQSPLVHSSPQRVRLHGLIAQQLKDIALRVPAVRGTAVLMCDALLQMHHETSSDQNGDETAETGSDSVSPAGNHAPPVSTVRTLLPGVVAEACCWVLGEFGSPTIAAEARGDVLGRIFSILDSHTKGSLANSPAGSVLNDSSSGASLTSVVLWSGTKLFLKTVAEGPEMVKAAGAGRMGQLITLAIDGAMQGLSDRASTEGRSSSASRTLSNEIVETASMCSALFEVVSKSGNVALAFHACNALLSNAPLKAAASPDDLNNLLKQANVQDVLSKPFSAKDETLSGEDKPRGTRLCFVPQAQTKQVQGVTLAGGAQQGDLSLVATGLKPKEDVAYVVDRD